MIHVITGLPGSFKTTWALREVCLPSFGGRRIFAHGVNGLKLENVEVLDADGVRRWEELPAGSVILVDEAQKLFPARGMHAGKPPEWIERLAEHRHGGFDFLLVTQHPTFIDAFVRKLSGRHTHLTRRFGMERATVYQWEEVKTPESESEKQFAVKSTFVPDPSVDYGRHESATVHTHKRRLPWKKLLVLGGAAAVVVVSALLTVRHLTSGAGFGKADLAKGGLATAGEVEPRSRRPASWAVLERSPRAEAPNRPESAPLYDDLQIVKSQPRVSGCVSLGVSLGGKPECYCTTDQGTIIPEISVHACRTLLKAGWWDETKKPVDTKAEQIARLNAADAPKGAGAEAKDAERPAPPPAPLSASTDVP